MGPYSAIVEVLRNLLLTQGVGVRNFLGTRIHQDLLVLNKYLVVREAFLGSYSSDT